MEKGSAEDAIPRMNTNVMICNRDMHGGGLNCHATTKRRDPPGRGGIVPAKTDVGRQMSPANGVGERHFALNPEEFRIVCDIQKNQKT